MSVQSLLPPFITLLLLPLIHCLGSWCSPWASLPTQPSTCHRLDPALPTKQKLPSQRSPETEMPTLLHVSGPPLPQPLCDCTLMVAFILATFLPVLGTPPSPGILLPRWSFFSPLWERQALRSKGHCGGSAGLGQANAGSKLSTHQDCGTSVSLSIFGSPLVFTSQRYWQ